MLNFMLPTCRPNFVSSVSPNRRLSWPALSAQITHSDTLHAAAMSLQQHQTLHFQKLNTLNDTKTAFCRCSNCCFYNTASTSLEIFIQQNPVSHLPDISLQ